MNYLMKTGRDVCLPATSVKNTVRSCQYWYQELCPLLYIYKKQASKNGVRLPRYNLNRNS